MQVVEAFVVEEAVDRLADPVANSHHGAERVGSGSQVRPFAKFFERVPFLLQRVGFSIAPADDANGVGVQFGGLAFGGGLD